MNKSWEQLKGLTDGLYYVMVETKDGKVHDDLHHILPDGDKAIQIRPHVCNTVRFWSRKLDRLCKTGIDTLSYVERLNTGCLPPGLIPLDNEISGTARSIGKCNCDFVLIMQRGCTCGGN